MPDIFLFRLVEYFRNTLSGQIRATLRENWDIVLSRAAKRCIWEIKVSWRCPILTSGTEIMKVVEKEGCCSIDNRNVQSIIIKCYASNVSAFSVSKMKAFCHHKTVVLK